MTDKTKAEPWDHFTIRRTDSGWDFTLNKKSGGMIFQHSNRADTFDEAVNLLKERYDVS